MVSFLKCIWRPFTGHRRVKFLGRAGIVFNYRDREYFVDSEMLAGATDMVVFAARVALQNEERTVVDNAALREEIIAALIDELKKEGVRFEVRYSVQDSAFYGC